jgi:hypothetical protein
VSEAPGEFTVVVDVGQSTDMGRRDVAVAPEALLAEFGQLTNQAGITRRKAISTLSRRYGIPPNEVYDVLERGKKLAE